MVRLMWQMCQVTKREGRVTKGGVFMVQQSLGAGSIESLVADPRNLEVRELGQVPEPLVEALRAQMQKLVEAPNFIQNLVQIERLAARSRELATVIVVPMMAGGQPGSMAGVTLPGIAYNSAAYSSSNYALSPTMVQNHEQFGARAIRELVNLVPEIAGAIERAKQRANPAGLVAAIATAKERGLVELGARLESKLLEGMEDDETSEKEDKLGEHVHAHVANGVTNGSTNGASVTTPEASS
jgi:hypothetical protein